jgi:hypothetical protein
MSVSAKSRTDDDFVVKLGETPVWKHDAPLI